MRSRQLPDESSARQGEPIPYAPAPSVVSVRGFRLLLVLTLVNTALLGGYVLGPHFFGFAKSQWSAYQQRKAERERRAKQLANHQAAMAAEAKALVYAAAPGTLLYDDDSARRDPAVSTGTPVAPWPAVIPRPQEADALPSEWVGQSSVVLFMHGRQASANTPPKLVIVLTHPRTDLQGYVSRVFWTASIRPTTSDDDAAREETRNTSFALPEGTSLRVYAGEADKDNLSRFSIPYELAGERGVIHGQLQGDGSVRLVPDGPLLEFWPKQTEPPSRPR